MTPVRRGLTLLEVVAAAALLAVIAAACVPMLREARRWADRAAEPDRFDDLVAVADAIVADPEVFGLVETDLTTDGFETTISPPELDPDRVRIRLLQSDDEAATHAWVALDCDGDTVIRYVELPVEADE